jgi:hypothetical protein
MMTKDKLGINAKGCDADSRHGSSMLSGNLYVLIRQFWGMKMKV